MTVLHAHFPDGEVAAFRCINNQQMAIRYKDGSEIVVDRATMVRCEAVWQAEAERGTIEAPEPPMPGVRMMPTNDDPLVKDSVERLLLLWAEANDDLVEWVAKPLEEAIRLLDPAAMSQAKGGA